MKLIVAREAEKINECGTSGGTGIAAKAETSLTNLERKK